MAFEFRNSAFAFVARASEPCIVCSRIRIEVSRTWRCVFSTLYAVLVNCTWASASSLGNSVVALSYKCSALLGKSWISGVSLGSAIRHRSPTTVVSCSEMASEIVEILSRKKSLSPERMSRSVVGI